MLIAFYIIGVALIIFGCILFHTGILFLRSARDIKKRTLESIKILDKNVKNKYNRVALLPVTELDDYLSQLFAICLETSSAEFVSEKDPNASVMLYAKSFEYMLTYLGNDTVEALEYFYGSEYLSKWCELRFNLLNTKKCIVPIINKTMGAEAIRSVLISNRIRHTEKDAGGK